MDDSNKIATQDETRRTGGKPTREDGQPMRMKEMDHTPPVEGPNRTFERYNEGRPAKTDGGQRPADGNTTGERRDEADEDDDSDEDGGFRQKMKEMDHTPPVEGPNRTFERGNEADEDEEE